LRVRARPLLRRALGRGARESVRILSRSVGANFLPLFCTVGCAGAYTLARQLSMRVLIVEDEPQLRDGLCDLLCQAGHSVEAVSDGLAAAVRGVADAFDLVVLDLRLPGLDGVEVCRRLKTARPGLPILMLTARGSEDDKVKGFSVGADDYLTKPFGTRELLARVEALGRRSRAASAEPELLEAHGCRFDLGRCEARRGDDVIALTAREVGIVRWLHRQRARAVSRAELLEQVWQARADLETRTVDVTVANLRQKIEEDPANPRIIIAVKGIGYAWGGP
jgi:DNA-binding response OmpR family regulator